MKSFFRSRPYYPRRQVFFSISLLTIFATLQIVASNRLIGLDTKLTQARNDIRTFEDNNELIQQKIASSSALTTLAQKAKEAGLTGTPRYLAVSSHNSVALGLLNR